MFNYKKIFAILSLTILLLVLGVFVLAKDLEVKYPDIGDKTPAPTSTEAKLTDYIRYIFALSIRIAGFIALGVMIYGGIKWLVSGGSPGKIADARSQILGGFLGIIILLSSYLILKTINPVLVSTTLYKEPTADCSKCSFNQDTGEITDDCGGHEEWKDFCKLELDHFKSPGVYLIGTNEATERVHLTFSQSKLTSLTNDVTKTTIDLNNKVTEIRFGRNNTETPTDSKKEIEEYCAILHEYENFEGPVRVVCRGETTKLSDSPSYSGDTGNLEGVSSITIFQLDPRAIGRVAIYPQQDFEGTAIDTQDFSPLELPEQSLMTPVSILEKQIYSVQIEGSFLVLLCGEDVYSDFGAIACQTFTSSVYDIRQTTMGLCDPTAIHEEDSLYFLYHSCVSSENVEGSFAVFKIKPMGYVQ